MSDESQPPTPDPGTPPPPAQPQFNPQTGYPAPPPPPPGAYPAYPQATGQQGLPQFPVYVLPDHPKATSALVVGIVSVAGFFMCVLPVLAAPVAWVLGAQARREIRNAPHQWAGDGRATAGMVLGIVGTVLLVLAVIVLVLLIAIIASDPNFFDDDTSVLGTTV
jgi:hypothetical protein